MAILARAALVLSAAIFFTPVSSLTAQVLPALPPGLSTADAIELFQTSPAFRRFVNDELLRMGLTPQQMRGLLRSAGYPPEVLDAFLGFTAAPTPTPLDIPSDIPPAAEPEPVAPPPQTPPDTGLSVFGLDVFTRSGTAFDPAQDVPVGDSYRLGTGDRLVLLLTGQVEASFELNVTRDGYVVIPQVGQVWVSGLSVEQFRQVLYDRLPSRYQGISRSPNAPIQFDIIVTQMRTQTVFVIGEVSTPGSYPVAAGGGVMHALYHSGGVKRSGSLRRVQIRRGEQLVGEVDLYDYLLTGVVRSDVRLQPGDVVFVPIHGPHVKIVGEVERPAIYELGGDETLRDLIAYAGGLTPYASAENITIDRILPPGARPEPGFSRQILSVALGASDDGADPFPLMAADSVTVFAAGGVRRNTVAVEGSVWQPGPYQLDPDMRLSDLLTAAGGLRPGTYEGRVQIRRLQPDSSYSLLGVVLGPGGIPTAQDDPVLREGDEVTVFSRTDFRPRRFVTIQGAVQHPGTLEFADSMTLRDAILLAQGLTDDAFLLEAEIARIPPDGQAAGDSLISIFKIPMDSSYIVDGTGYVRRPVGASRTVTLHPYDNIFIRRTPGWETQRLVVLTGEVRFPGSYALARADERIASVVERAGGLTPNAYGRGAQFFRAENGIGRVAIDLPTVVANRGHADNLVLSAGDSIHIPRFIPTVQVAGAVNFPTSVTYVAGADIGYYINAAGGAAHRADRGSAFVQQPNGSVEVGARPEPGSLVTVPVKDPSDRGFLEFLPLFATIVQVFSSTATLIIALNASNP